MLTHRFKVLSCLTMPSLHIIAILALLAASSVYSAVVSPTRRADGLGLTLLKY